MKVLIIGITGFAGTHMYHLLTRLEDIELYGTFRHSTRNRNIIDDFAKAVLLECDVHDVYSVEAVLSEVRPEVIFHFASYVSVFSSFKNPLATFHTNIIGTANLLEAAKKILPKVKILIPGSAEEYGKVPEDKMPVKEDCPLNPMNPYGISKKVQEEIGLYYSRFCGLNIYFTRTFHYTGPGQPLGFVCSDLAKQVVDAENERIKSIKVGNLEAKRDFTDIRDVVDAYWKIVDKGKAGEIYNVCSGESIAIKEILDKLIKLSGKDISVELDRNKLRPSDVPRLLGNNKKLINIGWSPQYLIDDSLMDTLERWKDGSRSPRPFSEGSSIEPKKKNNK